MRKLAASAASTYEKVVSGTGACKTADVDVMSKKVWAAALGCGAQNTPLVSGLKLKPLTSGSPLQNVRVVATLEVTGVAGAVLVAAAAFANQGGYGAANKAISAPGRYTVVGQPFTPEANMPFEARAWVGVVGALNNCGEICGATARIVGLKWDS